MPGYSGGPRANAQGSRARDSQRSKVYAAEDVLRNRRVSVSARLLVDTERHSSIVTRGANGRLVPAKYPSVAAVQAYVDDVTRRAWFVRRWGNMQVGVRANSGSNATSGIISIDGGETWTNGLISINAEHRWSEAVILHELAHLVTPKGCAHHGPEFAGILLTLVKHVMGAEHAADLRASFKAHRARYTLAHAQPRSSR